ncbi:MULTISPECIES: hypothetical protein [unclassified Acinetobacter]|uniref:hypothetical protein n=1 Tax=unclassified Acinetobacter TaxID=196816 RepID=UPI0012502E0D|nr:MULTISPECIES: hypothetical protein [unclassified Acinetobacter]
MTTFLTVIGISIYVLVVALTYNQFLEAATEIKFTTWERVKPVIWLFILIILIVAPIVDHMNGRLL